MLRRPLAQALGRQAIAADRPGARVLPKRLPMRQRATPASGPVPVHVPPQAPRVLLAHGREWRSRSRELERALRPAGYTVLEAFTGPDALQQARRSQPDAIILDTALPDGDRSEEHTSELQSHSDLVCRLLLEKKKETQPQQR